MLAIVLVGGSVTAFVLAGGDDEDEKAGDPGTSSSATESSDVPSPSSPAAPTSPAPSSAAPSAPTAPDPSTSAGPSLEAMQIGGSWTGTYRCPQGPTKLSLTMASLGEGDGVQAVFEFGPTRNGPAVPNGAFLMEGTITGGELVMAGTEWLDRPTGYSFVGLRADVPDATVDSLTGEVTDGGCSTFKITR
ncbi:hypothetical protein [Nocardioides dongxiaopingii]|uniref:hypothetical protein n=1 Tax=Nocardioides dongxiaopingii TaxID=2576036 RepID=UPI0010C76A6B|nr:hypothetical protein [Nocardioides dongxiaopingii]